MKTILIVSLLFTSFNIFAQKDSLKILNDAIIEEDTFYLMHTVEKPPEFPDGLDSLYTFIEKNNNWQVGQITMEGKVFVSFIIEEDGKVSNIELVKKFHPECDNEAIRIISKMPAWQPGSQNGKPVRTKVVLPIFFDGL